MHLLKNMTPILWIIIALSVLISGFVLIFNTTLAFEIIKLGISILVVLVGIMYILSIFLKNTPSKLKALGIGLLCLIGGAALLIFPQFVEGTFNVVAGILGIIIGLLILLNALKLRADGASYVWTLLTSLFYIIAGISMLRTAGDSKLFGLIFGLYLIVFSFNIFGDAMVSLMHSNDQAQKLKRHIRVPLPAIFAAFLPMKMLRTVNDLVQEAPDDLLLVSKNTPKRSPDMEIYIHTREGLIPGMGHVDIALDGTVYTYGNYDDSTWKLGGFFADGVLVEMGRQDHIDIALNVEKKILMVYGLSLNPEQKEAVYAQIKRIHENLVPWQPLAERCEKGELEGKPEDYTDTSSQLYHQSHATFYKFKKGDPFKTYYAVGTNCVKLADTIVGHSGIDLLRVNGIITPGTYLDYLDSLYERGDSIVITRTLYCNDNPSGEDAKMPE